MIFNKFYNFRFTLAGTIESRAIYEIEQEGTAKLLGMKIDDDMNWSSHIKGLVSALNQRTSVLRRMKNRLNDERLKKIVDSIFEGFLANGSFPVWCLPSTNGR